MSDPDHKARLEALEKRIAAAKGPEKPPRAESHESQASLGWRMVIELVTGLLVGFGMGYGLDRFSLEVLEDAAKAGLLQVKEF